MRRLDDGIVEVHNLRKIKPTQPYDFRIDRLSILGNPYPMAHESERDVVCNQYEEYFRCMMTGVPGVFYFKILEILEAYKVHGKVRLFCWCVPKRCHGETIKNWLENTVRGPAI